jgi:hypothetical protein
MVKKEIIIKSGELISPSIFLGPFVPETITIVLPEHLKNEELKLEIVFKGAP